MMPCSRNCFTAFQSAKMSPQDTRQNTSLLVAFFFQKRPLIQKTKTVFFQDRLLLNAGQKLCRMFQRDYSAILSTFLWGILQYFRPSLSYNLSFRLSFIFVYLKTGFTVAAVPSYTHMRICVHVGTSLI